MGGCVARGAGALAPGLEFPEAPAVGVPVERAVAAPGLTADGVPLAVPVGEDDDVEPGAVVPVPDAVKMGGSTEDDGPVQAEADAETRTVMVAQPAAVSLALLTFMRPPRTHSRQRR